jgi:hypothetical protein
VTEPRPTNGPTRRRTGRAPLASRPQLFLTGLAVGLGLAGLVTTLAPATRQICLLVGLVLVVASSSWRLAQLYKSSTDE